MKNRIGRVLSILCILVIMFFVVGCDLAIKDTIHVDSENALEFSIDVPAPLVSRGINDLLSPSYSVWVKVLNSNGEHVPATNTTDGITELTYASSKWSGTVNLAAAASGSLTFYIWAQVDVPVSGEITGEHKYVGNGLWTYGSVSTSLSISTSAVSTSYKIGSTGPAGGIVFYDKGEITDGWRYLEAAPSDFTYSWSGIPLAPGYSVDVSGNVILNAGSVVQFYNYQWYWGPPDKDTINSSSSEFGTLKSIAQGVANKTILTADAVSGSTPRFNESVIRDRKKDNVRRDLAKTVSGGKVYIDSDENGELDATPISTFSAASIGGVTDWYVPTKDELSWMYSNLKANGLGGFSNDYYWSSSESYAADNPDPTAIKGPYPKSAYKEDNVTLKYTFTAEDLHAWVQNFSTGAQSQVWRNELARVRPVRRF